MRVKKIVLILVMFAFSTIGFADNGCVDFDPPGFEDAKKVLEYKMCSGERNKKKRCKCIHSVINQGLESAEVNTNKDGHFDYGKANLQSDIENANREAELKLRTQKSAYFDQHSKMYRLMTVQASAQRVVMGLDKMDPMVGCTAKEMADGIKTKSKASAEEKLIPALETKHADYLGKAEKCKSKSSVNVRFAGQLYGCEYFENKANYIANKISKLKDLSNNNDKENCLMALKAFESVEMKEHFKKLSDGQKTIRVVGNVKMRIAGAGSGLAATLINSLNKLDNNVLELLSRGDSEKLITDIEAGKFKCSEFFENIEVLQKEVERIESRQLQGGDAISNIPSYLDLKEQCKDDLRADPVCLSFALKNRALHGQMDEITKPVDKSKKESCITYAEYITLKGMPSPELLKDFAKSSDPGGMLINTDDLLIRGKEKDKVKFLQSNPLILQMAQDKDQRQKVGKLLQNMAKDIRANGKKDQAAGFRRYLDFMQNEFNSAYKNFGAKPSMNVCDQLQQNFTAISLTDNFHDKEDKDEGKFGNQVYSCVKRLYENIDVADLDDSLKLSEIYSLGEEDPNHPTIPTHDLYLAERDNYCENPESRKKTEALKDVLEEKGVKSILNESDRTSLSEFFDGGSHDSNFVNKYHEEVTLKTDQNALSTKGNHSDFRKQMESNSAIYENSNLAFSSKAPEGFESHGQNSSLVRPVFENSAAQMTPSPAPAPDFKTISPEKIQEAKKMTDIDPDFEKRSVEDKLSTLKALQNQVFENKMVTPNFKLDELTKSIEKTSLAMEELEKAKEEEEVAEKLAKNAPGASSSSRSPASEAPQSRFIAPVPSAPVIGQFPRFPSETGSFAKISKLEASYQKALIQKYNISPSLQVVIQDKDAPVSAPYEIKESNIFDAGGDYPFSRLTDTNTISEFLAIKVGDKIKTGESVKIVDPITKKYFLMYATVENGVVSYQNYPPIKEEDIRIAEYEDLKRTMLKLKQP